MFTGERCTDGAGPATHLHGLPDETTRPQQGRPAAEAHGSVVRSNGAGNHHQHEGHQARDADRHERPVPVAALHQEQRLRFGSLW